MRVMSKSLTRGARAHIYRDGHALECAVDIPAEGAFAVRHLPAGQYTARDSCGGEQSFTVTVDEEWTTILNGDGAGVTGGPGSSGVVESSALRVGPGGGVITTPDQVAVGENITDPIAPAEGEAPAEVQSGVPDAERAFNRPKDPESEVRVLGQAGAARVQDAPIRSVAEVMALAKERNKLHEPDPDREDGATRPTDERFDLEMEALDAAEVLPRTVRPDSEGPAPERSTELAPGEGGSASASKTPIDGAKLEDPQPELGVAPAER